LADDLLFWVLSITSSIIMISLPASPIIDKELSHPYRLEAVLKELDEKENIAAKEKIPDIA